MQPSQDAPSRLDGPLSNGTRSIYESTHIHPSRLANFSTAPILEGEITEKVQSSEDVVDAGESHSEKPRTRGPSGLIPTLDLGLSRRKKTRPALREFFRPRKTKGLRPQSKKSRSKQRKRELDGLRSLSALQIKMDGGLPCGICNQLLGFHTCPHVASSTAGPKFIVQHPIDAAFFAAGITNANWMPNKPRLVFYTDGAAVDHHIRNSLVAGAGITYKQISRGNVSDWTDSSCGIVGKTRSDPSELYAVGLALETATNELEVIHKSSRQAEEQDDQATLRLLFITDSQSALKDVHDYISSGKIPKRLSRDTFLRLMRPIIHLKEFNVPFEFHWVPGHTGIGGNVRADALAGLAARWTLSRLPSIADKMQPEYQVVQIPKLDGQALVNIVGPQPSKLASKLYDVLVPHATECNSAPEEEKEPKAVGLEKDSAYTNAAEQIQEIQAQWMRSGDSASSKPEVSAELQDQQVSKPEILNPQPRKRKASPGEMLDPRPPKRISKVEEVPDRQDPNCNSAPEMKSESRFMHKVRASMAKQIGKLQALWKRSSDGTSREL